MVLSKYIQALSDYNNIKNTQDVPDNSEKPTNFLQNYTDIHNENNVDSQNSKKTFMIILSAVLTSERF